VMRWPLLRVGVRVAAGVGGHGRIDRHSGVTKL
jgi:hypothetical protein